MDLSSTPVDMIHFIGGHLKDSKYDLWDYPLFKFDYQL
jgi:hypothetical protein